MILTEDNYQEYTKGITLTGDDLLVAIAQAQAIIESPNGANRPLDITEKKEILTTNGRLQNVYLSWKPVLLDPAIIVRGRYGKVKSPYGEVIPASDWETITGFRVDDNELTVLSNSFCTGYSELEITYSSGFDFTDTTNPDVEYIKRHTGILLTYMQSPSFQGVKILDVPFKEFKIEFSQGVNAFEVPDWLMLPFRKYAPIGNV
jgi:hypothetical protein